MGSDKLPTRGKAEQGGLKLSRVVRCADAPGFIGDEISLLLLGLHREGKTFRHPKRPLPRPQGSTSLLHPFVFTAPQRPLQDPLLSSLTWAVALPLFFFLLRSRE